MHKRIYRLDETMETRCTFKYTEKIFQHPFCWGFNITWAHSETNSDTSIYVH